MQPVLALALCAAVAAIATPHVAAGPAARIINGDVAQIYAHPHIASLQTYMRVGYYNFAWAHTCGGSLITPEWVLTAAHCVDTVPSNRLNTVRVEVGATNLYAAPNQYEQTVGVAQIIVHPQWDGNAPAMPNDIALIKLVSPVVLNNNVKVVQLAERGASFLGSECVLAGWGQVSTGATAQSASDLLEVPIIKVSTAWCQYYWGSGITDKHICVHDTSPPPGERPSACMGDSGGPMMCGAGHATLAGVTSWGDQDCTGNLPSVYTRVSSYRDWIFQYVGI